MSQHEIERYINHFFKEPGTFLEIGCWDGEVISQTYEIEKQGWKGVCVDPFPVNFKDRLCQLCVKAVSNNGQPRRFIKVSVDRRGGDVSYFSGFLETLKENWPLINDYCDYEEITVETITFEDIFKQYNLPDYVEFLSIDTEGSELEIFESIDFGKYSFGLIVFEHNTNEEVKLKIGNILRKNGYSLHEALRVDDIYINNKILVAIT